MRITNNTGCTIDVALCDIESVRLHCRCNGPDFLVELRVSHRGEKYAIAKDCNKICGLNMWDCTRARRNNVTGQYEAGYWGCTTAHESFATACTAAVAAANERRTILEAAIASAKADRDYAAALSAQINGDN